MAITYSTGSTGSSTNTVTPVTSSSLTIASGDLITFAVTFTDANPAGTLTISNSGTAMTWTLIADVTAAGCRVAVWWARSANTENRTVSVAWSSGNALEWGMHWAVHADTHATTPIPAGNVFTGNGATSVSRSITPTASGSALWLVAADANNVNTTTGSITAGTNCTLAGSQHNDQYDSAFIRPTTQPRTDAAAFTLAETHTGSGVNWVAFEVQAAAAGGGGSSPKRSMLLGVG